MQLTHTYRGKGAIILSCGFGNTTQEILRNQARACNTSKTNRPANRQITTFIWLALLVCYWNTDEIKLVTSDNIEQFSCFFSTSTLQQLDTHSWATALQIRTLKYQSSSGISSHCPRPCVDIWHSARVCACGYVCVCKHISHAGCVWESPVLLSQPVTRGRVAWGSEIRDCASLDHGQSYAEKSITFPAQSRRSPPGTESCLMWPFTVSVYWCFRKQPNITTLSKPATTCITSIVK